MENKANPTAFWQPIDNDPIWVENGQYAHNPRSGIIRWRNDEDAASVELGYVHSLYAAELRVILHRDSVARAIREASEETKEAEFWEQLPIPPPPPTHGHNGFTWNEQTGRLAGSAGEDPDRTYTKEEAQGWIEHWERENGATCKPLTAEQAIVIDPHFQMMRPEKFVVAHNKCRGCGAVWVGDPEAGACSCPIRSTRTTYPEQGQPERAPTLNPGIESSVGLRRGFEVSDTPGAPRSMIQCLECRQCWRKGGESSCTCKPRVSPSRLDRMEQDTRAVAVELDKQVECSVKDRRTIKDAIRELRGKVNLIATQTSALAEASEPAEEDECEGYPLEAEYQVCELSYSERLEQMVHSIMACPDEMSVLEIVKLAGEMIAAIDARLGMDGLRETTTEAKPQPSKTFELVDTSRLRERFRSKINDSGFPCTSLLTESLVSVVRDHLAAQAEPVSVPFALKDGSTLIDEIEARLNDSTIRFARNYAVSILGIIHNHIAKEQAGEGE